MANRFTGTTKYTDEVLKYVQDHLKEDGYDKVAKHLGVTTGALKKQITHWREQKKEIPFVRWVNNGDTRILNKEGVLYQQKKEGKKWVTVERLTPMAERRGRKPNPNKLVPEKKQWAESKSTYGKTPKKAPEKYKTKVVDPASVKKVRMDAKTHIEVPLSIPDQVAIDNYWKKRKSA